MFTSDQQWQDRQSEIAAYQHHQEQMNSEDTRYNDDIDYYDESPVASFVFFGLVGALLVFLWLQTTGTPIFNTDNTWELWGLIAVEIISFIISGYVLPTVFAFSILALIVYLLFKLIVFIF